MSESIKTTTTNKQTNRKETSKTREKKYKVKIWHRSGLSMQTVKVAETEDKTFSIAGISTIRKGISIFHILLN